MALKNKIFNIGYVYNNQVFILYDRNYYLTK